MERPPGRRPGAHCRPTSLEQHASDRSPPARHRCPSPGLRPDARREQVRAAVAERDRLTRLFEDILGMARIEAQAITTDRQWVTPADVVDAAAAYVRHALEGRTLRIQADSDAEVHIDPR